MNFLAHLFLGRDTDDLLVGSYLGDFVKGEINGELPTDITRGILLHRHIDSFTDRHPLHKITGACSGASSDATPA